MYVLLLCDILFSVAAILRRTKDAISGSEQESVRCREMIEKAKEISRNSTPIRRKEQDNIMDEKTNNNILFGADIAGGSASSNMPPRYRNAESDFARIDANIVPRPVPSDMTDLSGVVDESALNGSKNRFASELRAETGNPFLRSLEMDAEQRKQDFPKSGPNLNLLENLISATVDQVKSDRNKQSSSQVNLRAGSITSLVGEQQKPDPATHAGERGAGANAAAAVSTNGTDGKNNTSAYEQLRQRYLNKETSLLTGRPLGGVIKSMPSLQNETNVGPTRKLSTEELTGMESSIDETVSQLRSHQSKDSNHSVSGSAFHSANDDFVGVSATQMLDARNIQRANIQVIDQPSAAMRSRSQQQSTTTAMPNSTGMNTAVGNSRSFSSFSDIQNASLFPPPSGRSSMLPLNQQQNNNTTSNKISNAGHLSPREPRPVSREPHLNVLAPQQTVDPRASLSA